jgi:hypothetical protein
VASSSLKSLFFIKLGNSGNSFQVDDKEAQTKDHANNRQNCPDDFFEFFADGYQGSSPNHKNILKAST